MKALEFLQATSEQSEIVLEWHRGQELQSKRITGGFSKWLFYKHHDPQQIKAMNSKVRMVSINDDGSFNVLVAYDETLNQGE